MYWSVNNHLLTTDSEAWLYHLIRKPLNVEVSQSQRFKFIAHMIIFFNISINIFINLTQKILASSLNNILKEN